MEEEKEEEKKQEEKKKIATAKTNLSNTYCSGLTLRRHA